MTTPYPLSYRASLPSSLTCIKLSSWYSYISLSVLHDTVYYSFPAPILSSPSASQLRLRYRLTLPTPLCVCTQILDLRWMFYHFCVTHRVILTPWSIKYETHLTLSHTPHENIQERSATFKTSALIGLECRLGLHFKPIYLRSMSLCLYCKIIVLLRTL